MEQIRRRRLGADAWRAILERFSRSDLTVQAFCQQEAVSVASFYRWRSLLGTPSARKARLPLREPSTPQSTLTPSGFLDLGTLGASPSSHLEVRLELGGGLVLHVVRG